MADDAEGVLNVARKLVLVTSSLVAFSVCAREAPAREDPSKHRVQFVTVEEGVRLEVLDWGGSGRAVVLLAGSGNSAHVFDDFAPKLTDCCHVYGITRRGYGASTRPLSGYHNQRLADDVLAVLDTLHIDAPVLVGHSMAGGELTTLGNQHSDRLAGLVYLDALGDPRDWPASDPAYMALMRKLPPRASQTCPEDRTSFSAYRASQQCSMKFAFPESELRNIHSANSDGSVGSHTTPRWIHDAIGEGEKKREYSNIRVPVLALYEFPRTLLAELRPDEPQPRNDEEREALLAFALATKAFVDRWARNLTRSVPDARLVNLPGAGHYVFLTREAEVLRDVRQFVAKLPQGPSAAAFEVASVTPSRSPNDIPGGIRFQPGGQLTATNVTLKQLVEFAHKRNAFDRREAVGGPSWFDVERFDIAARAAGDHVFDASGFPRRTLLMLKTLLADRFQLRTRFEDRDRPIYALVASRDGALGQRLRRSAVDCAAHMQMLSKGQRPDTPQCAVATYPGRLVASAITLPDLASVLSDHLDRPVIDRTGLTGVFDVEIEAVEFRPSGPFGPSYRPSNTKRSIFEALPDQLGIELRPTTGSVEIVIVEHAEKPTEK